MKINRAFSLIELLIVISIIGILAAIAAPAYKRYKVSTELSAVMTQINDFLDRVTKYASVHGRYPGPDADYEAAGIPTPSMMSVLNPDISIVIPFGSDGGTDCGSDYKYLFEIHNNTIGDPEFAISVLCLLTHSGGIINRLCYAGAYTLGSSYPDNLMPGVPNLYSNSDYGRIIAYSALDAAIDNSTCM